MTQKMERSERFWDGIAAKYAAKPVEDIEAYNMKLDIMREYLNSEARVYEFGCGTGSTALFLAPHVKQLDASDISEEMLKIAQKKAEALDIKNINFDQADITCIAGREGQYDVILGMSILHLLENRTAVLKQLNAMLKPGGYFISSTACLAEGNKLLKPVLQCMQWIGKAPYISVFSQEQLVAELTQTGFDVVHQWQPKKNAALFLVVRKKAVLANNTEAWAIGR